MGTMTLKMGLLPLVSGPQGLSIAKSDDVQGCNEALYFTAKGEPIPRPGTPESFKLFTRELQSLGLTIAAR